jgi:hypothetical protein
MMPARGMLPLGSAANFNSDAFILQVVKMC